MSSYSVKVYNTSNKILTIDLRGIQEFIKEEEDIIFLKKNLNFMIGLWIGRIPADNECRRAFLRNVRNHLRNVRNNKSDDKYQEVFVKYLEWFRSMPHTKSYFTHFLEEIEISDNLSTQTIEDVNRALGRNEIPTIQDVNRIFGRKKDT